MISKLKKATACLLAVLLCVTMFGCLPQKPPSPVITVPSRDNDQILPTPTQNTVKPVEYTPVYASTFGDTVLLATVPVEEWNSLEPSCPTREISNGGRISCKGEHEKETPITTVIILEDLIPKVTSGWFRDMVDLRQIKTMEKLHTHAVTDMSYMFTNCKSLTISDFSTWDVTGVTNMAHMFDGCDSMGELPEWYEN